MELLSTEGQERRQRGRPIAVCRMEPDWVLRARHEIAREVLTSLASAWQEQAQEQGRQQLQRLLKEYLELQG